MSRKIYKIVLCVIILFTINTKCFGQDNKDYTKEWKGLTRVEACLEGMENYIGEKDIINKELKKGYKRNALETGAFGEIRWIEFLKSNKNEVVNFLISQISDVKLSRVHVCPFNIALKGELAIYCLQHILKVNWYEIDEYKKRFENSITWDEISIAKRDKDYDKLKEVRHKYKYKSYQDELQKILKSKQASKKMVSLWSQIFEVQKSFDSRP